MLDSGLKEKFIGMAKEVSDFNEFSFELEGYLPRDIDFEIVDEAPLEDGNLFEVFEVLGDAPKLDDVIEFLANISIEYKVSHLKVAMYSARVSITIYVEKTLDHSTNIDFDFLDEVQRFVKFVKRWKYGWLNKYDGQVT